RLVNFPSLPHSTTMHSLSLLVATALLAVAAAQPTSPPWDATARDKTDYCKELVQFAPEDKTCDLFDKCCSFDPLNGDKCQKHNKICQQEDDGTFTFSCKYTNCTAMITTTTTTTTQSPAQVNVAAPVSSLCLLISTVLPRFLF
ncbi:hypothetical protein PENTCL1PPCAC_532, partial [Pristionchus entomophagus]